MGLLYDEEKLAYRIPLKVISMIMAMIMVFSGGIIACYAQGLGVPEKLEIENIMSDYIENIIDFYNVKSIDTEKTDENELYFNMKDGSKTVYAFSEPVIYTDENGNLKCKDNSIVEQTNEERAEQGYDYSNGQNDYRINFSSDSSKGILVEYNNISFSFSPKSDVFAPGYISKGEICNEEFEDFEYADLFGYGTFLKYFPQLNGIKEEIVLDEKIERNSFSFILKANGCTPVINEDGTVSLISDENEEIQSFTAPFAYDSAYIEGVADKHYCADCKYTIEEIAENVYTLTVTVSDEWLSSDNTVYPVTIDPTTGNLLSGMDLPIHSKKTTSGTSGDNNAVGVSSEYGISRTLVYMGWTSDIKKYAKINSAYYYARELTGRTSGMGIEVYRVTSHWNNDSSWSSRPDWDSNRVDRVNVNGNYNGGSQYWYKFNISSVVQSHINGDDNRGFMLKYDDEDGSANLRTFAQKEYSTSSMRPYVVINYTNDTTVPIVEKVTKTPSSEWSNQDVTISISGAKDDLSGLAQYPYSFSTQQGVYDWHTMTEKTFTQSCKVWVYVQDNAGNINNCAVIDVKIDRVAPTITSVKTTEESDNTVTISVTASDSSSGIAGYSFDGGVTWQNESIAKLSINTKPQIAVKDNAGNVTYYSETAAAPEIYKDNNIIYIYTPGISGAVAEYKINDSEWIDYSHPFSIPVGENVTVYARNKYNTSLQTSKVFKNTIGSYIESASDMSLSYFGAGFDISRYFDSSFASEQGDNWIYSFESKIDLAGSNNNIISAVMPDGLSLVFEKTLSGNLYINKFSGSLLIKTDSQFIIKEGENNYTYDANGVLVSVSDLSGNAIAFANIDGKITSITAGVGHTYTISYNLDGEVESITNPLGESIKYDYTNGKLSKVYWDKSTFVIEKSVDLILGEYKYNSNGTISKSLFNNITYNLNGQVIKEKLDDGSYTEYTYTAESYTYSDSSESEEESEETGEIAEAALSVDVIKITAESSNETTTQTKVNNALLTVASTDAEGKVSEYKYNDNFMLVSENANSVKTDYTYNSNGDVLTTVSDKSQTNYTYNLDGDIATEYTVTKDNDDKETKSYTKYEYENGALSKITQSEKEDYSNAVVSIYSNSMLVKSTDNYDSNKATTTDYTYDSYGNTINILTAVVSGTESTEESTSYTYDSLGRTLSATDKEGTTSYIYDAAGNTISTTNADGTSRTIIDTYGRTVQSITFEDYDSVKDSLPSYDTYSDNKAGYTYVYAKNGTLTSETNRLGKTTKYYYNDRGSKIREEFDIYKFYYLNHGELYQVKVSNVTTVSYGYSTDGKFQLLQETYANDDIIQYKYDSNDNVIAQYKNSNSTPYVTYKYNEDGDLIEKVNTETQQKTVYDKETVSIYDLTKLDLSGEPILYYIYSEKEESLSSDTETSENARTVYSSNAYGNQISRATDSDKKTSSYSINNSSFTVNTERDSEDRVTALTKTANDEQLYKYTYTYDDKSNITAISQQFRNGTLNIKYTYDEKGRITYYEEDASTYAYYTYDTYGQIVRVDSHYGSNYTSVYEYDNRGNIKSCKYYNYTRKSVEGLAPYHTETFTYGEIGSIWPDGVTSYLDGEYNEPITFVYDEIGNPIKLYLTDIEWTAGRQLSALTYVDEDGNKDYVASFTYDENGIRTSKTFMGKTTYYTTENGLITSERCGEHTKQFIYDENGEATSMLYDGTLYHYVKNAQGDVIGITAEDGTLLYRYEYNEWGKLVLTYSQRVSSEYYEIRNKIEGNNPILYRGYYWDSDLDMYYLQSRYYSPDYHRFINADDTNYLDVDTNVGLNLFAYCCNDPVNRFDKEGSRYTYSSYQPPMAKTYADKWWNKFNPLFKQNKSDCANFVSQCLLAGGLSKTIKWNANKLKITSAWGQVSGLYSYLKNNKYVKKSYTISKYSDVDVVGKVLYSQLTCCAVLFFDWNRDGKLDHAGLSGQIIRGGSRNTSYDIYYYAHSANRNGKRTTYNGLRYSIKDIYNREFSKMRVYVFILYLK